MVCNAIFALISLLGAGTRVESGASLGRSGYRSAEKVVSENRGESAPICRLFEGSSGVTPCTVSKAKTIKATKKQMARMHRGTEEDISAPRFLSWNEGREHVTHKTGAVRGVVSTVSLLRYCFTCHPIHAPVATFSTPSGNVDGRDYPPNPQSNGCPGHAAVESV